MADILFVIILMAANIIQAITGFAGGPLSMPPCIALVGLSDAKASITLIFLISTAVVTAMSIKDINVKKTITMIVLMAVGMIPGMWLYDILPAKLLMIVYGTIVVLIGIWKMTGRGKEMKFPLNYIALVVAGMMQGMFTSGGPFIALYATDALKDKKQFRASVSSVWVVLNLYMCSRMYVQGMYTPHAIRLTAYSIIPVGVAIVIGNIINKKIRQETFLKMVYVLLVISGALLLFNALS